ncbi:hypothetical protein BW687_013910 [Pseudomonas graminis]|uniref:hypothetical protein n=1 Tax=Pseudomonas graminis TaxID=158627 RepID=UPI00234AA971|nr:hypothetical protein [Pseudomonas graminis]MDC6381264.1 hypothetical protein [Pseudomonas graminis]
MDRVIGIGCICLFAAGALFSHAAFGAAPADGFRVVDYFSVLSAIATAIAAYAAWRAASAAQKQSFDTAMSGRRQMYRTHLESFNEWLDGIEADQQIKFYRRHELYESMFPKNRNPALDFTDTGDTEISAWVASFENLAAQACSLKQPDRRTVEHWVSDYMFLSWHMKFTNLNPDMDQIRLDGRLASGISRENFESVLPVMGSVLSSLSAFAFIGPRSASRGVTSEFRAGFLDFIDAIQINSWHQHQYG